MGYFLEVEENKYGCDYAVGDVHGDYERLIKNLNEIGFDPAEDRLFFVGDLVDRGEHSEWVVNLIDNEVFFSVMGNHEALLLGGYEGESDVVDHYCNGGEWYYKIDKFAKCSIKNKLKRLPFAIEIPVAGKRIGIVHAQVPKNNWDLMRGVLEDTQTTEVRFKQANIETDNGLHNLLNTCIWARTLASNITRTNFKINPKVMNVAEYIDTFLKCYAEVKKGQREYDLEKFLVDGIDHVYVGHNTLPVGCTFGDYTFLDTGAFKFLDGLTIVNITEIHKEKK